jgi:hypothetical protein
MSHRVVGPTRWVLATALAVTVVGVLIAAAAKATVIINQPLAGTVHAPRAHGQARLRLKTPSSGTFTVKAKRLPAGQTFDVVVNKVKVGTLTTGGGGNGSAKFSTTPHGRALLMGFDPQGQEVEIRDDQGDDDLDSDMPDKNPDSALGCCLGNDEDETECEDLTAAECSTKGGTPTTASSCLPNPCGNQPPPTTAVCCITHSTSGAFVDDDPEVECEEDTSQAECAAQGGTLVQATSCEPNPCQPIPPAQIVACCVPDGDESECEEITPDHCTARDGTVNSATSCDPNPCPTGSGGNGGGGDGGGGDGSGN